MQTCQGNLTSYLSYYGIFYVFPIVVAFSGSVINLSFTLRHDRSGMTTTSYKLQRTEIIIL